MSDSKNAMSRRAFISISGGAIGFMAAAGCGKKSAQDQGAGKKAGEQPQTEKPLKIAADFPEDIPYAGFRMGIQSWCLREFSSIEVLIDSIHKLGLAHVELAPNPHLPLDSTDEQLEALLKRFQDEGITIDSFGVVKMENDEPACRRIFEIAGILGVLAIGARPQPDSLPLLDRLTEEYGIPITIHNHGLGDELYATGEMIRSHLSGTSSRIGLCVDTGHFNTVQVDPIKIIEEFSERIHGVHVKDLVQSADGEWRDAIVGRGDLDLPALVAKLKDIGFNGVFSLEYESDPSNPMPAMRECLAEIRKACKTLG